MVLGMMPGVVRGSSSSTRGQKDLTLLRPMFMRRLLLLADHGPLIAFQTRYSPLIWMLTVLAMTLTRVVIHDCQCSPVPRSLLRHVRDPEILPPHLTSPRVARPGVGLQL